MHPETPTPKNPWERELRLKDSSLYTFKESRLHKELEGEDPRIIAALEAAGGTIDNLSYVGNTIFAQVNIARMDQEAAERVLDDNNLHGNSFVGYGTGIGNVGFTTVSGLWNKISSLSIKDSEKLSLFIPF